MLNFLQYHARHAALAFWLFYNHDIRRVLELLLITGTFSLSLDSNYNYKVYHSYSACIARRRCERLLMRIITITFARARSFASCLSPLVRWRKRTFHISENLF
jgi:hypothetical protein